MSFEHVLERIQAENRKSFESEDRLRTFEDFLRDLYEHPYLYLRTAPQYLVEMFEHFGTRSVSRVGREVTRFRVFDADEAGRSHGEYLVGQEHAQNKFYEYLTSFAQKGRADKMVLLHGPNGSGKTSFVECVGSGLERCSRTSQGELLRFNWVFSERDSNLDPIGFDHATADLEDDGEGSLALLE